MAKNAAIMLVLILLVGIVAYTYVWPASVGTNEATITISPPEPTGTATVTGVPGTSLWSDLMKLKRNFYVTRETADIIIYKSGDYAVAYDVRARRVLLKSMNHGMVLKAAINALYDSVSDFYVGSIFIDKGTYVIKERIDIPPKSWLVIRGDGVHSTVLKFTGLGYTKFNDTTAAIWYYSDTLIQDKPFHLDTSTIVPYSQHLEIADLAIDTQDELFIAGIYAKNIDRIYIHNVRFKGYYSERNNTPSALVTCFAIYIDTTANNEVHIENVKISGYYTGVRLRADHSILLNVKVGKAYIAFMYSSGAHTTNIHPESYLIYGYHHYFSSGVGYNIIIINPSIEGSSTSIALYYAIWGDKPLVINPYIAGGVTLSNDPSKFILRGKKMENEGKAVFSGDGLTTQFIIPHGLGAAPGYVEVTPCSSDAASEFFVTADDTNIYVNYKTAPPSGTDNICLYWRAVIS